MRQLGSEIRCLWRIAKSGREHFCTAILRIVHLRLKFASMPDLFSLIAHLLVTLAKLARPGGLRAVAAESLAVKQQLLIMKRAPPPYSESDLLGSAGAG